MSSQPPAAAADEQSATGTAAEGAAYDPRRDDSIFRPSGLIVLPRSDGDASYVPFNTVVPPKTDPEVNYFHVFGPEDQSYSRWCNVIGADLAQWAGRPSKAPNGKAWKLDRFPDNYLFTEQRKGPRHKYRTDPYLFGSHAHRFRSTKEFLPHAKLLILDPTMSAKNCECKYCSGSRTVKPVAEGAYRKAAPAGPRVATVARGPHGRKPKAPPTNLAKVKTQSLPPPAQRPVLGVSVPSATMRDNDLARQATAKAGECEGFRQGEVVWVELETPIPDPNEPMRQIDKWPGLIKEVTFEARVETPAKAMPSGSVTLDPRRQSASGPQPNDPRLQTSQAANSFPSGHVTQQRKYAVVLIGAPHDQTKVHEERLTPFLSDFVDGDLAASLLQHPDDFSWIHSETGMPERLCLFDSETATGASSSVTPGWASRLAALAFSVTACNFLRCRYRLTDPFDILNVPGFPNYRNGSSAAGPSTSGVSAQSQAMRSAQSAPSTATTDGELTMGPRSSLADRLSTNASREDSVPRVVARGKGSTATLGEQWPQPGQYWQGMYLGVERIWVGDVVRLKLANNEIRAMFAALASEKKLARKTDMDPAFQNLSGSYVMRLRAIFEHQPGDDASPQDGATSGGQRPSAASKTRPKQRARIAGSIYQIMTIAEFDRRKFEEKRIYEENAQKAQEAGDPFAGRGKRFAFPRFDLLSSWGLSEEMPDTMPLQQGFVLSPVTVEGHEVILEPTAIAGRLYPSLARPSEGDFDLLEAKKELANRLGEESQDSEDARLAVAGALPGAVKPMGVDDEATDGGEALLKMCFDASRAELRRLVEAGKASQEAPATAADAPGSGLETGQKNLGATRKRDESDQGSDTASVKRVKVIGRGAAEAEATPVKGSATSSATAPSSATAKPGGIPDSNAETRGPDDVDGQPATSSAPAASSSSQPDGASTRASSPPLPPGWVKKVSRSGHGTYYANKSRKETSWERPTS
ncbi:unnamed protein product [Parajaminaea phylloscopi]